MPILLLVYFALVILAAGDVRSEEPAVSSEVLPSNQERCPSRISLGFFCTDTDKGVVIAAFDLTDRRFASGIDGDDVLIAINGIAIEKAADIDTQVLPSLEPFKPTSVELRRHGKLRTGTIIPVSYIGFVATPVPVSLEVPQSPKRVVPPTAGAAETIGAMNVLTHALLDPATGDIELTGHYDTRFPTGGIPYKDLLKTALSHPNAAISLEGIADDAQRNELMQDMKRQQKDPYSVTGWSLEGNYALALLDGHPSLARERQQFIRLSCQAYGLTPQEFIGLHNFLFVETNGTGVPLGIVEIVAKALRHTGYEKTATAWRFYGTQASPEAYREVLSLLGHKEGQLPGSLRVQALLALLSTFRKYQSETNQLSWGVSTWAQMWREMLKGVEQGRIDERELIKSMERALLPRVTRDGFRDLYGEIVEKLRFSDETLHLARLYPDARVSLFTHDLPRDTQLSRIMYEADFCLKSFDNFPEVFEGLKVYRRLPDVIERNPYSVCWEPQRVQLEVSPDRRTVSFGAVDMRIRFMYGQNVPTGTGDAKQRWEMPKDNPDPDGLFQDYFANIANNIDQYATVVPSFHELREAAKVVALARWSRQNKVRIDLGNYEQTPWVPPAFIKRAYTGRLEYRYPITLFERHAKLKFWGGVTFQTNYDWVSTRVDAGAASALPSALVLSSDLGQRAAEAAIDGNLERARSLAELSAQAMTGRLTQNELSQMRATMRLAQAASAPLSPKIVRAQSELNRVIMRQVEGVQQGTVSRESARASFKLIQDAYREVRTNPSRSFDLALSIDRPLKQLRRASGGVAPQKAVYVAFVTVPVIGRTWMGSLDSEKWLKETEKRVAVELTEPFMISMTEITQRQCREVMGVTPWVGKPYGRSGDHLPATWVTWHEAVSFCETLTAQLRDSGELPRGECFRLPTEAEWECACRGGTMSAYSFGNNESQLGQYAWFKENTQRKGEPFAHSVGTKSHNPWGLYDMHGNVMEWCSDWYGSELTGGTNPKGPSQGTHRVCRGGSWGHEAIDCRSASRFSIAAEERNGFVGFRVVRAKSE